MEVNVDKDCRERPSLDNRKTYEQVKEAAEFVLRRDGKVSSENTLSGKDLFSRVAREFPSQFGSGFNKGTFAQYLSNTVRDAESRINCLGRGRGYYLSQAAEDANPSGPKPENVAGGDANDQFIAQRQKEKLLYPLLEAWLIAQGYQAKDVSAGRSNGKWGNPDVAGMNAIDAFNTMSIEIVTVEAKISLANWEQWIFEAVSHRRFANRSYFAFAHPEELIKKIPPDMRYYAELFGVGVLALSMDTETFQNLESGRIARPLESDDAEVVEIFSAPFNFVQPKYQVKYCEAVGIKCPKEFYRWGAVAG